jgi:hypothetical protein
VAWCSAFRASSYSPSTLALALNPALDLGLALLLACSCMQMQALDEELEDADMELQRRTNEREHNLKRQARMRDEVGWWVAGFDRVCSS